VMGYACAGDDFGGSEVIGVGGGGGFGFGDVAKGVKGRERER